MTFNNPKCICKNCTEDKCACKVAQDCRCKTGSKCCCCND